MSVYVPPSNVLSEQGRKMLAQKFPQIKTIASNYFAGECAYTQEFEVADKNQEISLLPKEVVMMVLPTEEVEGLLEFVKKELYTGHIGDGKIFVSDVTHVVRVRTGEEGYDALVYGEK